jgi:hypothetical protein
MMRVDASHLPRVPAAVADHVIAARDGVQAVVPALDPVLLDRVCADLLAAREHLTAMPVGRVIRAIDAATRRLLAPAEPERIQVLHSLRAISGFSDVMASHVLDRTAQDWLAPQLDKLVRDELGGPESVESFVRASDGRRIRAIAPPLSFHVFSGNVPGVGVTSIVRALLVRSAVLGKSAAAEPALAPAFARLLLQVDPAVGSCVAVTYWRGGDAGLEDAALARAGVVVHYGGADAINALRARAPAYVRFVAHGPRISFALIEASAGAALDRVPHDLARAVALFDQQGCVSPQLAYVIGTPTQARDLARATASALADLQRELPRGRISPAEAAAIRELRTRAEFGAIAGRGGEVWAGSDLDYSVILSDDPAFEGTCLNRTLLVKHVPDLSVLLRIVAPFHGLLQTVGVAGFDPDHLPLAAAALADAGATRITPIADMPWPPPAWHHDGRGPLRELVRWADLEGER